MLRRTRLPLALGGVGLAALVAGSSIPGGLAQAASSMKLMDLLPQGQKDLLTRTLQSRCLHRKESDPLCSSLRNSGMGIPHGIPDQPTSLPSVLGQQQPGGGVSPAVIGHSAQQPVAPGAGAPVSVQPMAQPTAAPYGYAAWPLPQPFCPSQYSPCPWTQPANTPWTGNAPWNPSVSAAVWYFNQATSNPVGRGANPNVSFYGNSPFMRKFVDGLPGLGAANKNNLGVYIPVATKASLPQYPASDYYEIKLVETQVPMHSDISALTTAYSGRPGTKVRQYQEAAYTSKAGEYPVLGPLIIAQRDTAVRIRFQNALTAKSKLFLPVDPTIMGAGNGPSTASPGGSGCGTVGSTQKPFSENRANIHVHGSFSPWIGDGTPHQWITPVGDDPCHPSGWSQRNVPDMPNASSALFNGKNNTGEASYFHPNVQTARLEWYHDHSYGLTRLNVYAGEAAPYILTDPIEQDYINGTNNSGANPNPIKALPDLGLPLIIQDRSFVNPCMGFDSSNINATVSDKACWSQAALTNNVAPLLQSRDNWGNDDPLWDRVKWGKPGDLWFPHSYAMNQYPPSQGLNPLGRLDYGYFMNPPWIPAGTAQKVLPGVSHLTEAFMDTPTINGVAYPYMKVKRQAYRFRILNGSNDRQWNLQLYAAQNPATGCPNKPPLPTDPQACQFTEADLNSATVGSLTYKKIPIYMIGNESGFLQQVVHLNDCAAGACPQPTVYDTDPKSATVLSVKSREIWLAPAQRADIIIDFSNLAQGDRAILYNDMKVGVPLYDARLDYNPSLGDQSATGGAKQAPTGYGPDVHNLMQFVVDDGATDIGSTSISPTNLEANLNTMLGNAWACNNNGKVGATNTSCALTVLDQQLAALPPKPAGAPVMGPNQFVGGFGAAPPAVLGGGNIPDGSWFCAPDGPYWWDPKHVVGGFYYPNNMGTLPTARNSGAPACTGTGSNGIAKKWVVVVQKDVLDGLFDDYGRMSAQLGTAAGVPANPLAPIPGMAYKDPPTEILTRNVPQVWMLFHGGVDSHVVHFHLSNVQVMNRYDIAGAMYLPDDDERGWKESVTVSPFTTTFVMVQPKLPPNGNNARYGTSNAGAWGSAGWSASNFPSMQRPADVTMPVTTGRNVTNPQTNYYGEYVWHCHILGHEENDMMRPVVLK